MHDLSLFPIHCMTPASHLQRSVSVWIILMIAPIILFGHYKFNYKTMAVTELILSGVIWCPPKSGARVFLIILLFSDVRLKFSANLIYGTVQCKSRLYGLQGQVVSTYLGEVRWKPFLNLIGMRWSDLSIWKISQRTDWCAINTYPTYNITYMSTTFLNKTCI